ncbi:SWIM zinc finger family protein [Desulfoluna sp.]|uniref:SWIM zinc finger family protein n=1 Tax=Desulfoluna sp. TaxID=2045199 RepID=UPI00263007C1|nr:SWIM zinc finger family protein [Desulfoluna sp.]
MSHHPNPFRNLTLDDIDAWIEDPAAKAGKKIHRQGNVIDLSLTEDGDLLAWVEGSPRHAVMIFFEDQTLTSVCSCPKGGACEHAAAAAFEYISLNSKKIKLPIATENDERLNLLNDMNLEVSGAEDYLQQLSRDQLLDLILDLADEFPDVDEELAFRSQESFDSEVI